MKASFFIGLLICSFVKLGAQPKFKAIAATTLHDKIKGGWAGQTIGVTFGAPYEFRFSGSFIQDYQPLKWYDGYIKNEMLHNAGLYDDLYMDLTFVEVFEKYGLDAPVDSFANAFAKAAYPLWHANQSARYNVLNGIKAPASGNWLYNPHADDIDFQIEADFAGLMSPGMPNTASAISDKIGHIMNYGDGWYGGVFIGAMYTQAFFNNDVNEIVYSALKTIPANTSYYRCISDVIRWNKKYPNDWHQTWLEIQKKWSSDKFCPDGIFSGFDIDATLNSAYVVMSLLYGDGDYTRSLELAARAGQDADCNPSTVGGILGAMLGYEKIPAYWKMGLKESEDIDFKYTNTSLNKVYAIGYNHAIQNIRRNGGIVKGDSVYVKIQTPVAVKFEQGFTGLNTVNEKSLQNKDIKELSFEFEGNGFVLKGQSVRKSSAGTEGVIKLEITIDNEKKEIVHLPTSFLTRRNELYWNYQLENKQHKVSLKVLNPDAAYSLDTWNYFYYTSPMLKNKFLP